MEEVKLAYRTGHLYPCYSFPLESESIPEPLAIWKFKPMKNRYNPMGNGTLDPMACSTLPQPTAPSPPAPSPYRLYRN